jgi:hypothetical protein
MASGHRPSERWVPGSLISTGHLSSSKRDTSPAAKRSHSPARLLTNSSSRPSDEAFRGESTRSRRRYCID